MDDYSSGVTTTIIDLGLSRMNASPTEIHWTLFEPEFFEGEGDYQFDIYRMMRDHNGGSWKEYRPQTNVMVKTHFFLLTFQLTRLKFQWLHYLLHKLISSKGLRAPPASRRTPASGRMPKNSRAPPTTSGFSERECYECLLEMEFLLGAWLESVRSVRSKGGKKKGRNKTPTAVKSAVVEEVRPFRSAGDVLGYGVERSWVPDDQ